MKKNKHVYLIIINLPKHSNQNENNTTTRNNHFQSNFNRMSSAPLRAPELRDPSIYCPHRLMSKTGTWGRFCCKECYEAMSKLYEQTEFTVSFAVSQIKENKGNRSYLVKIATRAVVNFARQLRKHHNGLDMKSADKFQSAYDDLCSKLLKVIDVT